MGIIRPRKLLATFVMLTGLLSGHPGVHALNSCANSPQQLYQSADIVLKGTATKIPRLVRVKEYWKGSGPQFAFVPPIRLSDWRSGEEVLYYINRSKPLKSCDGPWRGTERFVLHKGDWPDGLEPSSPASSLPPLIYSPGGFHGEMMWLTSLIGVNPLYIMGGSFLLKIVAVALAFFIFRKRGKRQGKSIRFLYIYSPFSKSTTIKERKD